MLKNKNGFQVNISLSIFFIAFCDLFTDFPTYNFMYLKIQEQFDMMEWDRLIFPEASFVGWLNEEGWSGQGM
jgi:hypothetical protein